MVMGVIASSNNCWIGALGCAEGTSGRHGESEAVEGLPLS